jgi:hypothetical protein
MKRNCLVLTVLVAASVCLLQIGCEEQQSVAMEGPKPELIMPEPVTDSAKAEAVPKSGKRGPEITFEKVVHDFGNVGPGSRNVCEFKFANTGSSLLKITNVSKTCGCTPYILVKREYEPGESGVLKVKYNASKRPGSTSKHLFVSSNDEMKPRVELTIKANIVSKVDYQPKRLTLSLNEENAGCPAITIESLDGQPFSIRQFKVVGLKPAEEPITADYDSSVEATEFVLQPKVSIEKLQKVLDGRIEITLTHPANRMVAIPFRALPRFKITPPSLIVYKAEEGKPVTKEVWVLSNYDEDFEIESTSAQKGAIKVLSQERRDNRYKFKLEITPPAAEEGQRSIFTDMFFVDIKGGERLKVACRIFYLRKTEKSSPAN